MNKRYEELDSLRGLAALSVVFCHFLAVLPSVYDHPEKLWFLKHTPLHILWAGHEAVIFFFVLSGFVLSLQFYKHKVEYRGYIIKRICRIYIPYLVCVIFAIVVSQIFYSGPKESLSSWFNRVWTVKPSLSLIIEHFLLISSFRNGTFAPVLWSLVQEMRISIIFPLVMLLVIRFNWLLNIGFAGIATISSLVLIRGFHHFFNFRSDYPITIHYISMFIFGALLAKHRTELIDFYQSISRSKRYILIIFGVGCYLFYWQLKGVTDFSLSLLNDWMISIGVSIFIISALGSGKISYLLKLPCVIFLGQISYSLYLFHTIVLLLFLHLYYGRIPLWCIYLLALGVSIVVSKLSYKYIEIPSIKIGRWMSQKSNHLISATNADPEMKKTDV